MEKEGEKREEKKKGGWEEGSERSGKGALKLRSVVTSQIKIKTETLYFHF